MYGDCGSGSAMRKHTVRKPTDCFGSAATPGVGHVRSFDRAKRAAARCAECRCSSNRGIRREAADQDRDNFAGPVASGMTTS